MAKPTIDNFLLTRMGRPGAGAGTGPLGSAPLGKLVAPASPFSPLTEMWYGVFLWALMSSVFFHVPAGLLALFTLRHHKYGRLVSVSILFMGVVGPITAGILTSMLDVKTPSKTCNAVTHLVLGLILEMGGGGCGGAGNLAQW